MKKPKIKLDSASVQTFFVHHVEKIVLVVVLAITAWLVYSGYALPGLEAGKTPGGLKQVSNTTRQFIDNAERWTKEVAPERQVEGNLDELVKVSQLDIDPRSYFLPHPLTLPDFPKLSPRMDPTLFAPVNIEIESVIGPLAAYPTMGELDPLYQEAPAEPEKKPVRKPPPRRTARSEYDPSGMMEGGMAMPGGDTGVTPSRRRRGGGGRTQTRSGVGGAPIPEEEMSMAGGSAGMMPGMSGPGGMYGAGGMSAVNPESIYGFQTSDQYTIARSTGAMVIKAVVPFEKQAEEFLNSLSSSLDYVPQRDQPHYLGFWVERAEIPADNLDADPTPLWKSWSVKAARVEQFEGSPTRPPAWAGVLSDVVDPSYLDPVLTHPAPPFMQRDIWRLLTHADVPLAPQATSTYGGAEGGMFFPATPKDGEKPAETPSDLPTLPGMGAGNSYTGGEGGMPGMTMPGMPGMSGSGRSYPGSGSMPGMGGMNYGSGSGSYGSGSGSYGSGSYGAGGSGSYGAGSYGAGRSGPGSASYDSGSYGYGEGYGGMAMAPPKYKLIRFTDTNVEEGKYYRYRVKVLLHDPNHPMPGMPPPTPASLDEKVRERLRKQDAEDAKHAEATKNPDFRTFWVTSPWSEPSEVVSLPSPKQYFVGSVERPTAVEIVTGKPKVVTSMPKAKVLTKVWDPEKVVDVPAEVDVFRGSILNFVQDAKVIHPVTHEVVDLTKYAFKTDAIVADLDGGDVLPPVVRSSDDPLTAPGEMLVIDAAGNLHVQDETEDIESFRRLLLPKEDPNAAQLTGEAGAIYEGGSDSADYQDMLRGPGSAGSYPGGGGGRGRSRGR